MLPVNMYLALLPLFKSLILTLEQKEPLVHRLHDKLTDSFRGFLALFFQHEVIKDLTGKRLKSLDVEDEHNHLPLSSVYVGSATGSMLEEMMKKPTKKKEAVEFRQTVQKALVAVCHGPKSAGTCNYM
jgi:hypothetical protein